MQTIVLTLQERRNRQPNSVDFKEGLVTSSSRLQYQNWTSRCRGNHPPNLADGVGLESIYIVGYYSMMFVRA